MLNHQLTVVIFVALAVVVCLGQEVEFTSSHDGRIILNPSDFAKNSYALDLRDDIWKTVSRYNDEVTIFLSNCQVINKSWTQLDVADQSKISSAINSLRNDMERTVTLSPVNYYNGVSFGYSNGIQINNLLIRGTVTSVSSIGESSKVGLTNSAYVISQPKMQNNLLWLLMDADKIGFVWLNGRIQLKPRSCLTNEEQQFVQSLDKTIAEDEEKKRIEYEERDRRREERYRQQDLERDQRYREREERYRQREEEYRQRDLKREQRLQERELKRQEKDRQREERLRQKELERQSRNWW